MLYKIAIENFYSIAEKQELIFEVPRNAPDLDCFKLSPSDPGTRLPTAIGFFGPNASGKSTVLRAIVSSIIFASDSFNWIDEINLFFQPYRQKDWWGKPSKIALEFDNRLNKDSPLTRFRYELHVSHKPNELGNKSIAYEALFYSPKNKFRCLFERENQKFQFGNDFGISNANDPRKESIRPDASVISTLAKLNHPLSIFLSNPTLKTNVIGVNKIQQSSNQWLSLYANNPGCLKRLNRELSRLDIGLEAMIIEQSSQGLSAKFKHEGLDDFIFLAEESSGTQRFLEIFPRLFFTLETGTVAILDELDTDLHPLLLPEIFRWFNDPERNSHGAQLLFTAHNPALLDVLEKEQIFFTQKSNGQPTNIYGAREIKGLRREPSLMKKYLAGELGAVPHIG